MTAAATEVSPGVRVRSGCMDGGGGVTSSGTNEQQPQPRADLEAPGSQSDEEVALPEAFVLV